MNEITLTLMKEEDVDRIHEIEEKCFAIPWSGNVFVGDEKFLRALRHFAGRRRARRIRRRWLVLDEAHVTNIAVTPEKRGVGYGEKVTRALIQPRRIPA
jgi:ribosomal-protein-alanine N-acetyltransferase